MLRKMLVTAGVAGAMLFATMGSAMACPTPPKTTICHATGSAAKPYQTVKVNSKDLAKHKKHKGDIVPAPKGGCPGPTPPPPPPVPVPSVPCVVGPGVVQTETTVTGTALNDTIDCTNASPGKTITGLDGNDTITGTAFNDNIDGGNGNDTITGGPGDDVIEGGNGNDTLTGSAGDDQVTDIGDGDDTITP